jgi:hypothetical protein
MTTPESASGEQQPPAAAEKKRLPRPTLGQIGAIVGVVGGVVGLVFLFKPGWKPQPPPDVGKAEVSDIRAREPVTFARYLQRLKLPQGSLSPAQLRRQGALVEFDVQLTGFAKKQLPLRWELIDAKTNDPVASDEAVSIVPTTNDDGRKWFVWVPVPRTTKSYYVTVTIYQPPKGDVDVPLQDFDSPQFTGLAAS